MHVVDAVLGLVALSIAVAAVAGRLRAPAPSALVLVGLGVGFLPGLSALTVSPRLVTLGVLPPLLFSAAQQISLLDLREVWRPVAVLAVGLVAVTAAVVAGVTHAVDPAVALPVAFTFGAVLASTDPVAVTALSRELRLPARVSTLVQAESLFNDATSLVLFEVAVAVVVRGHVGAGDAVLRFVVLGGGGIACGVVVGAVAGLVLRLPAEPTTQAALALLTPYVAAVAADAALVSPVTAVIVAGLMLARRRARTHQPSGRLVATSVYEVVVFVLENGIFAVIGIELASFLRDLPSADRGTTVVLLVVVTVTLLAVRGLALATSVVAPRGRSGSAGRPGGRRSGWGVGAVVTWAGARGVIPLAAALSIPTHTDAGTPFPHRSLLLVVATGVVVVTLVVQGTTLAPLVRRLGVTADAGDLAEELWRARYALSVAALDRLGTVAEAEEASPTTVERLRHELQQQVDLSRQRLARPDGTADTATHATRLRHQVLDLQAEELARLRLAGEISADTFRQLQHQLDIEHARLRG